MFRIVFISYNEPNADVNWELLKTRYPDALRLHGVRGIHNAHKAAAENLLILKSYTDSLVTENKKICDQYRDDLFSYSHFWVVDGDSTIEDDFNFERPDDLWDDAVYVYKSKNPANGLTYGYGGIKLLPILKTIDYNHKSLDMSTSISENFFLVDRIANTTNFNSDPFNAWKSAFRECVKLSVNTDAESLDRLNAWCTLNIDVPFGEQIYLGATTGREYGTFYSNNPDALQKINDFNWLTTTYGNSFNQRSK